MMVNTRTSEKNQPNREQLFQMAVTAARNGQRQGARVMFRQILQEDPKNVRVMLWLAKISRSKKERRAWLNRVLQVDPTNENALDALDRMDYSEQAERNRALLRIGIGVYLALVIVGGFALLLLTG